ncbi:MAG TPA: autotransporter-associated beta strand repeat-containing protein, partial [Candidatus Acidoferrum sp.]|nr:autotransporter-associated beta strand repeat-containing protein [Candidatus Acidoferrum sp.]
MALCLVTVERASAGNAYWVGTNGVSTDVNWSDANNFVNAFPTGTPYTPNNNAAVFNYNTAVQVPGVATVNVDGAYPGQSTPQAWDMSFNQTNGYHTVQIQPGITLMIQAAAGTPGQGFYVYPNGTTSAGTGGGSTVSTGPYTNHTVFAGAGGSLLLNGGFRVEASSTAVNNHYTILDMSGLDTFTATNTAGDAGRRFQVVNGGTRSQALVYLAKTNFINISSDVTIGWEGLNSNSLPIGMYLGQTNSITTGPNDNGNEMVIAIQGCTNGFLKFSPAVVGGATKPVVYISGNGAAAGNGGFPTVSGMMAGCLIGRADNARAPSIGVADFTGGIVTWNLGQLHLGRAGAANGTNTTAMGTLSFDDGTITVNDVWCGWQQYDSAGANGANPGIGVINVGTNATLAVNNSLRLGVVTGTPVAGSSGTVNVTGGTLAVNLATNAGGTAAINLTNSTLNVTITPGAAYTNITAPVITGGSTNKIAITVAAPPTSYPFTNHLIQGAIGGAGNNFGLQMPSATPAYVAHLVVSASGVDLVVSSGPVAVSWSGADPSGYWDIGTTTNWLFGVTPTTYNQSDYVLFDDTATGTTSVQLQAVLTPSTLTVSNNTKTYTFGGSGALSGAIAGGLKKQGTGTLILADTGGDDFTGGVTVNAGTVQVGDGSTGGAGSLGAASGVVANSGGLVFDRPAGDTLVVANLISGGGGVTNAGDGTVQLGTPNTFTGPLAINAGTVQMGNNASLGTTAGGTFIASGATLDLNGHDPEYEPITVQGTGVGGGGAIVNNASGVSHLGAVTLAGDVLFGGSQRWDLTNAMVASTPHNVTISSSLSGYSTEWRNLNASTAVNNLTIASGVLGWVGSTTAGTGGTLEIMGGAAIKFYNDAVTANVAKPVLLDDGAIVMNGGGANTISGPIAFNGYGTFNLGGTSLTLSGALSGSGTVYKTMSASPLYITGTSPAFSGTVLNYDGQIYLNGSLGSGTSSSINIQSGTTLAGSGVNNGPADISGGLTPGDAAVVGTITFGSLTLEGSAMVTNDLASTASGTSDLIVVNGDLTMNNPTMYINAIGSVLDNAHPYTLITYTGNFNGTLPNAQTTVPSTYSIVLSNATTLSPKRILAIVSGGTPNLLVWNNANASAEWDVGLSANWSNATTHAASDVFYTPDVVLFDDSITNAPSPATKIDIGGGQLVSPSFMTNNSTVNYTFSGDGSISGGASVVKMGSGTLTISNADSYTGPTTISGGTLLAASATALGATNGAVTITNGGTLDVGFHLGGKPVFVSGAGVGGNG